jgi:hypothetical protein
MRVTIALVTLALVYWFPVRRWFGRWGTTPDERTRRMPGDAIIVNPTHSATHAITIDAPVEDVWPLNPNRSLVLGYNAHAFEWVWQFGLYPVNEEQTRLVSRGTERYANTVTTWLFMRVMEPAAFVMTRRMLIGVKQRAEALRASRVGAARANPGAAA